MRLVMGLIDLSQRVTFSPAHPLADILHPPYPPIASQSISRDVPFAWARAFRDRALHEHRTSSGSILPISGAQEQRRCPSILFIVRVLRARIAPDRSQPTLREQEEMNQFRFGNFRNRFTVANIGRPNLLQFD